MQKQWLSRIHTPELVRLLEPHVTAEGNLIAVDSIVDPEVAARLVDCDGRPTLVVDGPTFALRIDLLRALDRFSSRA